MHPPQTNQERLRDYFAQFGDIEDVLIMRDPVTQVGPSILLLHLKGPIEYIYL